VNSYLTAYTLGANVENGRILATGTANLTGNTLNNVLYAGVGDNLLDGSSRHRHRQLRLWRRRHDRRQRQFVQNHRAGHRRFWQPTPLPALRT
jgi:hypothetical protein